MQKFGKNATLVNSKEGEIKLWAPSTWHFLRWAERRRALRAWSRGLTEPVRQRSPRGVRGAGGDARPGLAVGEGGGAGNLAGARLLMVSFCWLR